MTKRDLRTGMLLTLRNGRRAIVFKEAEFTSGNVSVILYENGGFDTFDQIRNDLTWCGNTMGMRHDIMKVEVFEIPRYFVSFNVDEARAHNRISVVWEREEPKRVTYGQLRAILGYDFVVVEDEGVMACGSQES